LVSTDSQLLLSASFVRLRAHGYHHAEAHVDDWVHTNGLENYWLLLKWAFKGTYVIVEPFHLFWYLHEQAFRFDDGRT
jgi:hypothetical protein